MRPFPPRHLASPLIALLFAVIPARAGEPELTLDEVVAAVRSHHPSLDAARARVEALEAGAARELAWADPMVGVNVVRNGTNDPLDPEAVAWMVEQQIPLSGRNRLAAGVATAETGVARADVAQRELDLVARAKTAYFELGSVHMQIDLNRRNQELVRQFIEISRKKYEVGREPQSTVLSGETELARLEEDALVLSRDLASTRARLNTLMNRPAQALLGRATVPDTEPALPDAAALEALAAARHPELLAAEAAVSTDRARLALARRSRSPDATVRVEARTRNGAGRVISDYDTALLFNVPWANPRRTRNEITQAERGLRASESGRDAARLAVLGELREQWERLEVARRQIALVHDRLLPLARQSIDAARVAYETDRATFLELITAQRTATEVESDHWRSTAEYHAGLAQLEKLAGGPLPQTP